MTLKINIAYLTIQVLKSDKDRLESKLLFMTSY